MNTLTPESSRQTSFKPNRVKPGAPTTTSAGSSEQVSPAFPSLIHILLPTILFYSWFFFFSHPLKKSITFIAKKKQAKEKRKTLHTWDSHRTITPSSQATSNSMKTSLTFPTSSTISKDSPPTRKDVGQHRQKGTDLLPRWKQLSKCVSISGRGASTVVPNTSSYRNGRCRSA